MPFSFHIMEPNKFIELNKDAGVIEVTRWNGEVTQFLVDSMDIHLVKRYQWFSHNGYCYTTKYGRQWPLTWELLGRPARGYILHHINGDRRDNRRSNLRPIPRGANNYFKEVQLNRSTGRRGISRYADGSIVALIGPRGKRKCFRTLGEAIEAREHFESTMRAQFMSPVES
jgi:hypothetical protein